MVMQIKLIVVVVVVVVEVDYFSFIAGHTSHMTEPAA